MFAGYYLETMCKTASPTPAQTKPRLITSVHEQPLHHGRLGRPVAVSGRRARAATRTAVATRRRRCPTERGARRWRGCRRARGPSSPAAPPLRPAQTVAATLGLSSSATATALLSAPPRRASLSPPPRAVVSPAPAPPPLVAIRTASSRAEWPRSRPPRRSAESQERQPAAPPAVQLSEPAKQEWLDEWTRRLDTAFAAAALSTGGG